MMICPHITPVTASKKAVERRKRPQRRNTSYRSDLWPCAPFLAVLTAFAPGWRSPRWGSRAHAHAARTLLDKYVLSGE